MFEAQSCLFQIMTWREKEDRAKVFVGGADIFLCCRVPSVLWPIKRVVYLNTNEVSQSNITLLCLSSMLRVVVQ